MSALAHPSDIHSNVLQILPPLLLAILISATASTASPATSSAQDSNSTEPAAAPPGYSSALPISGNGRASDAGLLAAAVVTPLVVLAVAMTAYFLWKRRQPAIMPVEEHTMVAAQYDFEDGFESKDPVPILREPKAQLSRKSLRESVPTNQWFA
ncbi:MAG: hypothetical protein M1829_001773 [Trizodia sp. TS-e1964]|nr:MAG: hypothetical protein M1829_001773 [Trizodia sp. TS-e1964]